MSKSKPLSIYAGIVAAASLLLLAFMMVKDYSSLEIPESAFSVAAMSVSLLSVILFASFCNLFSSDGKIRPAGFTLFLAFVLEFFGVALGCMPAAKSSFLIMALLAVVPIAGFILLVTGLFRIASKGFEYRRFAIAARCFAFTKLLYAAVAVGGGIFIAMSALNNADVGDIKELILKLGIILGQIVPTVAACWFYWEFSRWIRLRWDLHKEDYL